MFEAPENQSPSLAFDGTFRDIERCRRDNTGSRSHHPARTLAWLIKATETADYSHLSAIFRLADELATLGIQNWFFLSGTADQGRHAEGIRQQARSCASADVLVTPGFGRQAIWVDAPKVDALIATCWITVYSAIAISYPCRRLYYIRDLEPDLPAVGTVRTHADSAFRFGLRAICETHALADYYRSVGESEAIVFSPIVSTARPSPAIFRRPDQVLCLAAPNEARSGWELAMTVALQLKYHLGDEIRIVSAGANWEASNAGLSDIVENLGELSSSELLTLYAESTVAMALALSASIPSSIPCLMTSGCLVVSNRSRWTRELLIDGDTALLSIPTASLLGGAIQEGLSNSELRTGVTRRATERVRSLGNSPDRDCKRVIDFIFR